MPGRRRSRRLRDGRNLVAAHCTNDRNLLVTSDRAACQLLETLTVHGEEQVCSIAGFYELRGGRIASAKIYREGSAEVA